MTKINRFREHRFFISIIHRTLSVAVVALACSFGMASSGFSQDIQDRTIRWGHLLNPDHPLSKGVQKFTEIVAAKSGGKLKVKEFSGSQLGPEQQQQSALRGGTQEMLSASTTSLVGIIKEFGIVDFPFIVSTPEQADALLDGPFGAALLAELPDKGLIGLGYWDLGFRHVTNSRRPITKGEDLSGIKIRVIANPVYLETFKTFGASPVPLSFGELYTALETRTVDGQENPLAIILTSKYYEVQKYLSLTNHTYSTIIVLASKRFWDKLSPTEQGILKDAATEARAYQRKINREQIDSNLAELRAKGLQINEVAPTELNRMREKTKPLTTKFSAEYNPAITKLFSAELARVRGEGN
jgi:TRAP-type transport system periplasmic protein